MANVLHPTGSAAQDLEGNSEQPIDVGEFEVAFRAENAVQAERLVSACEDAGLPAILRSPRSGPVGTIASPVDGWHILVPRARLAEGQRLLEEWSAALEADPEGAARAAEAEEAAGENRFVAGAMGPA